MTKTRVETALRRYSKLPITSQLASCALIDALAEWDPSLDQLQALLASRAPLSAAELAHALARVSTAMKKNDQSKDVLMLTNGETSPSMIGGFDQQLVNRHQAESQPHAGGTAAYHESPLHRVLYSVLTRLYGFPSSSVTLALRDAFAKPQLRSLVDFLRLEIARNGWLSSYEDHISIHDSQNTAESPISLISHLLNSILDALGPTGWMLGASANDLTETAETLSYMKAEISAALEGLRKLPISKAC